MQDRRALILGEKCTASWVAAQLEMLGARPVLYSDWAKTRGKSFPRSNHYTDALSIIRSQLHEFIQEEAGNEQAPLLHPGTSLWAERAELATLGAELGFHVISPSARILSQWNDQLSFLSQADQWGMSHLVHSFEPMHSIREIEALLTKTGARFPIILKSVRSAGRVGICVVNSQEDLVRIVPLWLDQLRRWVGEAIVFTEQIIEAAKQISVPFVRFKNGKIHLFPLSDISLQSKARRVVEFCPATCLDPAEEKKILAWTEKYLTQCGFVGVGQLEFLVNGPAVYLIRGLARLHWGFHLWEKIAGTHAVHWQLATLGLIEAPRLGKSQKSGLAIHLYAEDPILQIPRPGKIEKVSVEREWKCPKGEAELRLSYEEGDEVSFSESGRLGSVFAFSDTSEDAYSVAETYLEKLWISGSLQTNQKFILELLNHPWVKAELFHSGFVDDEFLPNLRPPAEITWKMVALAQYSLEQNRPSLGKTGKWIVGDQKVLVRENSPELGLDWVEEPLLKSNSYGNDLDGVIRMSDGRTLRVAVNAIQSRLWVRIDTWVFPVRYQESQGPILSALSTGRVHAILFRAGALIPAHEVFLLIEAFGIFIPHSLPISVRIREWKIKVEDVVVVGQCLADFDSSSEFMS